MNHFVDNQLKQVAAYCRVSTDSSDQSNSLESQQRYFNEYINRNPMWELYEIYVDEGISGTSTQKRASFNRMIEDAKNGKFEIIVTKEISRFARNTLDSLRYTRELKACGVSVIFMNDNINTLDVDSELRLTIMSSIAQEEIRKTSDRVKWGQRRLMEQGVVFGRNMLGYDVHDGKLYINEEGAETVRLIFHKYLDEGKGCHVIAKELREAGIKTSSYMKDWSYTVILRVLRNEKYCGDLVQQKTYTPDYLTHAKKKNNGEVEFVVIRNHHEPIVSRERFEAVQRELKNRKKRHTAKNGFANRYPLSGKIICAECGSTFVHTKRTSPNGTEHNGWSCITKQRQGTKRINASGEKVGCSNNSIRDADIRLILQYVVADVMKNQQAILNSVIDTVSEALKSCDKKSDIQHIEAKIQRVESKKEKLLDMCLSGDVETSEYKKANERLNDEYADLLERLNKEKNDRDLVSDKTKIIEETKDFIHSIAIGEQWDDIFYRNIVDKIYVHNDRSIDVYLKLIPEKRRAKILKGKAEIEAYEKISPD